MRIPYVENVVNDPTQLSGRGFPRNFYMEFVLSGFYVFSGVNRVHHEPQEPQGVFSKVDRVHHQPQEFLFNNYSPSNFFDVRYLCGKKIRGFWRIPYVENVIQDPTQLSGRGFPHHFYIELVSSGFHVFPGVTNNIFLTKVLCSCAWARAAEGCHICFVRSLFLGC